MPAARLAARGRVHHFPRERRAVAGILAHEPVQVRRARTRQPDDEHGVGDLLALDLGMRTALCLEQQQILEQAHDELAHGDAAERRELGLVAIGLEQPLERLVDRPRAEVAHAGAPARGLEQAVDLEGGRIGADASQSSAACVQGTDGAAHAARGKAHRWGFGGLLVFAARIVPQGASAQQ